MFCWKIIHSEANLLTQWALVSSHTSTPQFHKETLSDSNSLRICLVKGVATLLHSYSWDTFSLPTSWKAKLKMPRDEVEELMAMIKYLSVTVCVLHLFFSNFSPFRCFRKNYCFLMEVNCSNSAINANSASCLCFASRSDLKTSSVLASVNLSFWNSVFFLCHSFILFTNLGSCVFVVVRH